MNAPFLNPQTVDKRRRQAKIRAAVVLWHRRIGLTAAAFVLLLSVTGIILSHAERFELHETTISPALAETLYDVSPAFAPVGVEISAGWLIWIDRSLYLNGKALEQQLEGLQGIVEVDGVFAVAGKRELLLFMNDGAFVERLNGAVLPGAPDRIARLSNGVIVLEVQGKHFSTTPDFLEWSEVDLAAQTVYWSAPTQALPQAAQQVALKSHGSAEITTHRFVSDLHSGRSFGAWGPFVMDAAAILLVVLSLTGFYVWWRQRSARPRKLQVPIQKD